MEWHQVREHGAEERAAVLLFFFSFFLVFSCTLSHIPSSPSSFIIYSLPLCNPVILSPSLPTSIYFSNSFTFPVFALLFYSRVHTSFLSPWTISHFFLMIGCFSPTCPDIPEDEAQYWTSKLERINTMRIHDEVSRRKVLTNLLPVTKSLGEMTNFAEINSIILRLLITHWELECNFTLIKKWFHLLIF